MSTFGGKIEEIPQISVDNFNHNNLNSEAYFLSHCHFDHMSGLNFNYQHIFLRGNKYLYASDISCLILRKRYPDLESRLRALDIYSPTAVQLLSGEIISVTPIPAGHCPGSIMFLFETKDRTVLYTGDYRINPRDLSKFNAFYDSSNKVKVIDKLYLDTTFFLSRYKTFPPRHQIVEELCHSMKEWMSRGKNNMINLHTPSAYGYEFLFIEIYKVLQMPIHLNETTYDIYKYFPGLDKATTTDGDITQIHSYCIKKHFSICKPDANVKSIKPSAMYWKDTSDFAMDTGKDGWRVCYSTHASLEEGMGLIKFLKPKDIEACVVRTDVEDNTEMKCLIDGILREVRGKNEADGDSCKGSSGVALADELLAFSESVKEVESLPVSACSGIKGYGIFNSPPKRCSDALLDSPPRKISQ